MVLVPSTEPYWLYALDSARLLSMNPKKMSRVCVDWSDYVFDSVAYGDKFHFEELWSYVPLLRFSLKFVWILLIGELVLGKP